MNDDRVNTSNWIQGPVGGDYAARLRKEKLDEGAFIRTLRQWNLMTYVMLANGRVPKAEACEADDG